MKEAFSKILPPTPNSDGTTTYHVMLGYTKGEIYLMRFFPDNLVVDPGDTVEWCFTEATHLTDNWMTLTVEVRLGKSRKAMTVATDRFCLFFDRGIWPMALCCRQ